MTRTDGRLLVTRRVAATVAVVALVVALVATPAVVAAAGTTDVVFDEADASVAVDEETTVPVVVTNVDGGVGAYNVTVTVDDPDVAQIADVELAGDPGLEELRTADDGSRVTVRAALADTDDEGEVTLLRVTLVGEAAGTTDVSLSVTTLGDEEGRPYTVADTAGTTITVDGDDATTTPGDGAATPGADESDDGGSAPDESESGPADGGSSTGSDDDTQDGESQSDTETTATPTSTPEPSDSTASADSTESTVDDSDSTATPVPTETPTGDSSPTATEQPTDSAAETGLASPLADRSDGMIPESPLALTVLAVGVFSLVTGVGYLRRRR